MTAGTIDEGSLELLCPLILVVLIYWRGVDIADELLAVGLTAVARPTKVAIDNTPPQTQKIHMISGFHFNDKLTVSSTILHRQYISAEVIIPLIGTHLHHGDPAGEA